MIKKYDQYRDSGINWIGNFPSNWNAVRLKWISNISKGKKPKQEFEEFKDGLLPYLSMEYLRNQTSSPTYADVNTEILVEVEEGDHLILWDGSKAGEIVLAKKGVLSSTMAKIEVDDSRFQDSYLNYLLQLGQKHIQANTIGMGIPHVSGSVLKDLLMIMPSAKEQTKIADYLDHQTGLIDEIIEKKQLLLENLKEQRQSIINESVTKGLNPNAPMKDSGIEWLGEIPKHWEVIKLKFLTKKIIDGAHFTPTYVDAGVPFLRVKDIHTEEIDLSKVKFIPESEHIDLIKRCNPQKGDVLLSKNGTIGIIKVIDWDWEFSIFVSLCLIKFKAELSPFYFTHFFNSSIVDQQIKVGSKTTSVTNLHLDKIKELIIAVPNSIDEQKEISTHLNLKLEEIDSIIFKAEKSSEQLKFYRQSIISEAVTGKIDVREWEPKAKETV